MTVDQVLIRLQEASEKGLGDTEVSIYCMTKDTSEFTCDCLIVDPDVPDTIPSEDGKWHTIRRTFCIM